MSNIPESYKLQNGCHNCKHVFVYKEHDCGSSYYCTLGAPARPSCMSVQLGEYPFPHDHELGHEMQDAWDAWSIDREVEAVGICDYQESSND